MTTGAIVRDRAATPSSQSFVPGHATILRSSDSQVEAVLPAQALDRPLTVQHSRQPPPGTTPVPAAGASFHPGFSPFYLTATDGKGQAVHQFDQPLILRVHYTPEQLQALNIAPADLTLMWFDAGAPEGGRWTAIAGDVDEQAGTVTVPVNHFSAFQLVDGAAPSDAFIPSLQGWQIGLYTGSASFSYPIEVPAGPAGFKPQVQLSYSSTSDDGKSGQRPQQQTGWLGKGWSLDTGYVAMNKLGNDRASSRYYTLVFDGQSFDIVRGDPLSMRRRLDSPLHGLTGGPADDTARQQSLRAAIAWRYDLLRADEQTLFTRAAGLELPAQPARLQAVVVLGSIPGSLAPQPRGTADRSGSP